MEFKDIINHVEEHKKEALAQELKESHTLIICEGCGEEKLVENGTWALEYGMCEPCYCAYQDGR